LLIAEVIIVLAVGAIRRERHRTAVGGLGMGTRKKLDAADR